MSTPFVTTHSTGPIENTVSIPAFAVTQIAKYVEVKVQNSSASSQDVSVAVYAVGRQTRTQIGTTATFTLPANQGDFVFFDLTGVQEYEVEVTTSGNPLVSFSSWGKTAAGDLVAAQRILTEEFRNTTLLSVDETPS